ncbi:protein of unknown function [Streptantibioticus cattleyicolor NRRL 8057 = DSM 46488]|nr:protein of unknown function [Streptantibioticus cattleyicolor NRRL 8057 = DSM 46488]
MSSGSSLFIALTDLSTHYPTTSLSAPRRYLYRGPRFKSHCPLSQLGVTCVSTPCFNIRSASV